MGTLTVSINSNPVNVLEGSFQETDAISTVSTLMFKVADSTGSNHYTKGMPVSITDSASGLQYTGFVSAAIEDRVSPNTLIVTDIGVRDNHYLAEKRTYDGPEMQNVYAGVMFCLLLNTLASEGITAKYAVDRDTTATDFNAGTLTGVVGASNVDDGDLELSPAGTNVTQTDKATADFAAGSLSSVDARNNQLNLHAYNVLKMTGTCAISGNNAFLYWKIWSGSQAISTGVGGGQTIEYDVWISSTSPLQQAAVDLVCSDGTSMRAFTPTIVDQFGINAHPGADLSGFANDQWYHRNISVAALNGKTISFVSIAFEGDNVGNYQAYFRNIQLTNGLTGINRSVVATFYDSTSHPYDPQNATMVANAQISNQGYSAVRVQQITAYDQTGNRISNAISIDAAKVAGSSQVSWSSVVPTGVAPAAQVSGSNAPPVPVGTAITILTSVDNKVTWQPAAFNAPIPDLAPGFNVTGRSLYTQIQLAITGTTPEATPAVSTLTTLITSAYVSGTTNALASYSALADFNTGTNSNTQNWSPNYVPGFGQINTLAAVSLTGMFYDWNQDPRNDANGATLFGATSPAQANVKRQWKLTSGTGTDVRSRLESYGGGAINYQNFTAQVLVQCPVVNGNIGLVYRTTGWVNANNTFAYSVTITTTQVLLDRATNGGASTGVNVATTALTLTAGNWYTLKVVVNGTNHQVFVDDFLVINATDATYTAAGQIGLRLFNGTGSTLSGFFENFGVVNALTGTWISAAMSLNALGTIGQSAIFWNATIPPVGGSLICESSIDGGSTWQAVSQGGQIGNLPPGTSVVGVSVQLRFTFTSPNASVTPVLQAVTIWAVSQVTASGNRISPALALTNVGRLGGSVVAWNALLPAGCTLGVDTRIDSGPWVDRSSSSGEAIPGITPQVAPTVDSFTADSSVNYSLSSQGGTNLVATYDTANSRITLTGGNIAFYVNNLATSVGDVDMFVDMDESDNGGLIFHYIDTNNVYELVLRDNSASVGPASSITLFRILTGTRTQVAQVTGIVWPRGSYHRFRVTMLGSIITAYMDGTQQFQYTDATPVGAGKCGLRNSTTATVSRYYQINIQPQGQDVSSHTIQTRLRLATTNPVATPQVTDVSVAVFGTTIALGVLIPQTNYFHKYIDKASDDLAQRSNFWWYIDKNKVPYFLPTNGVPAPWIGSSTPGWMDNGTLVADFQDANITVEDSSDLYRNRQIIENVLASTTINETKLGDGVSKSWTFGYQWAGPPTIIVTVNGVPTTATVGVKNVDTGKQFYWALGDNTITEDSSGPVYDATFTLNFSGPGQYLTYSQADNTAEQTALAAIDHTSGIVVMVEDGTGLTKAQGDALAQDRLNQYSKRGRLLKATTRRYGLAPGQLLNLFLPEHGINDGLFLIRQVQTKLTTEGPTGSMVQQPWRTIEAISGADVGDWTKLYQKAPLPGFNKGKNTGRVPMTLSFNVQNAPFNAVGDGVNDDTSAIQAALNAAAVIGGYVDLPQGTYKTSASLVITGDNVIMRGSGWGTVIKPVSGAQFDVISTPIPGSAGLSGFIRNYLGIENLMIDCSNMTGTTAGQGNGIHWYGVRYSYIRDVYVKSCKNWAILLDGDNTGPGNNFGYDCQVFRCVFDLCNAGVWNTNTEAHDIIGNRFKWAGTATAALQPALGTQDTNALHLRCSGGYMSITNNVFGKGGTYTTEAIRLSNSGPCKVIGNRFDQVRNQAIILNGGNHIFMGNQLGSPGSAISGVAGIQIGSSKNTIIGNKFDITAGAMNATYAIAESGGPFADNLIADNNLLTGTTGFINQNATSTNKVHHNAGYNPVGFAVAQPAVPASTVNATNNSGVDCIVHIAGGTLTAVTVGGTATGITAAAAAGSVHTVRVPAGQTINITYTVAPTWKWYGD